MTKYDAAEKKIKWVNSPEYAQSIVNKAIEKANKKKASLKQKELKKKDDEE